MTNSLLLGQCLGGEVAIVLGMVISFAALMCVSFVVLLVKQYKRCPSNRILVVFGNTGKGRASRAIHGGAVFVWPLIQDYAYLNLEPIRIEVSLHGAVSSDNVRVNVSGVFTVAIDTKPEGMQNAAVRLLGLSAVDIHKQAEEIICGQLRKMIASMGIDEINRDRERFLERVQYSLEPELVKIGLQLINVNISDITVQSTQTSAIGR